MSISAAINSHMGISHRGRVSKFWRWRKRFISARPMDDVGFYLFFDLHNYMDNA
jgi:hypothetical protein